MALKATIFKANLNIADIDRHYYHDHDLTIARHPSETDERMMVRMLAFALNAHEDLAFGRGLSTEDEPDLWQMDLTGNIKLWIELGLPDERRLRKASGRAQQVVVYNYGGRGAKLWWEQNRDKLTRVNNLKIFSLSAETSLALAKLANRNMALQCTIQEETVWLGNEEERIEVEIETLMGKD